MKKIFSFLLLGLLLSIGNAWAAFEKATSIAVGDQVVLVVEKSTTLKELSSISTTSTKYGIGTAYTETPAGTMLFDVVEGKTVGTFAFKNGNNYLYWGSGNSLATDATLSANSSWTVSFNGTTATITNAQQATRVIWWNATSPRFACYENKSDGASYYSVQLYKKITTGVPDPTFSPAAGTYSSAQSVTLACENDGAIIYYTTDGTEPTNASTPYTGAIAISATTTIKAIAYVGENASTVAHAEYRIITVEHAGTVQDPYTVADARNAIDLGTGLTGVYATGIVTEIVDDYSTQFSNITFDIIDEGGSDVLRAYRCGGAEAANVEVGDTVVVSGTLVNYNSVYEFSQGCQIVSLKHPVAPAVPSIDVEETSINATAEETDGTINVTYNNITEVNADIYWCDSEGAAVDASVYESWLLAEINPSTKNLDYEIGANTGAARTAYMKVYALGDQAQDVYSEIITISQAEYVEPTPASTALVAWDLTTNIFSFPEGSNNKTVTATDYTYGDFTVNVAGSTGEGYYWHTDGYLLLGKNGATFTFPAFDFNVSKIKIYGRSLASGKVTFNMFVGADAVSTAVTSSKEDHEFEIAANKQDAGTIYTLKVTNSNNCQIVKIEVFGYYELTLGTNGYSTYAADFSYEVDGANAYKAKYQNGAIVLTQVNVIEAGEGIVLKGANAGDVVTITPSNATADDFSDNDLVGVLAPTQAEATWYVLATNLDGDGLTKFHKCENVTIPANKAFIEIVENPSNAPIRIIEAGNNATDIQNIEGAEKAVKFIENGKLYIQKNGVVYDATGAKVK